MSFFLLRYTLKEWGGGGGSMSEWEAGNPLNTMETKINNCKTKKKDVIISTVVKKII